MRWEAIERGHFSTLKLRLLWRGKGKQQLFIQHIIVQGLYLLKWHRNDIAVFNETRKAKPQNYLTMMNPVMAGSVKDQFQGTEASDDLFIIKESHTQGYPWVCLRIAQTHGSHMRDVVQKVSSSFYLPRPSQEGGAHQTVGDTVWQTQTCWTQFSGQIPMVYCVIPGKPTKLFASLK